GKGKELASDVVRSIDPARPPTSKELAMVEEMYFRRVQVRQRAKSWAFKPADPNEAKLKELHGEVSARVETPPLPLATVDNIMKAAGKTFKTDGGSVKILSVDFYKDTELQIHVRMETPVAGSGMVAGPAAAQGLVRRVVRVNNNVQLVYLTADQAARGPANFTLLDTKGKAWNAGKT